MTRRWHHHPRALARAVGWTAGALAIALAVLAGLAELLLPLAARHPQWVAAQLSERLQRPVSFSSLDGRWQLSGPLFVLHDVRLGAAAGGGVLQLPEAQLKLDLGGWLLPSRHLFTLQISGLELDLSHDAAGRWHVNGIGTGDGSTQQASFGSLSVELRLRDLRLAITDVPGGRHYRLIADQLRVSRQGSRIRLGVLLHREGAAGRWHGAGSFRQDGSDGRLWLAGNAVDLHGLLQDVATGGYTARSGTGSAAVWLDWKGARVVHASARLDLGALALTNPQGIAVAAPALHGWLGLDRRGDGYQVRWAGDDGSALVLAAHQPGTAQLRLGLAARDLQLAPLLPWLALKPGLAPALAQWLGHGRPHGVVTRAQLQWSAAHGLQQVEAAFSDVGIDAVGTLPGASRLHGELRGDGEALSLALPAQSTVLAFPHLFRQPFALSRLAGQLAFWRGQAAWHVGVDPLDVTGQGYAGQLRGEVALPDDGAPPFVELYAQIDHADVVAAKLFLPLTAMSPATMAWFDRALLGGTVDSGSALVRGNLADWPFLHDEGRFEAQATLSGLDLEYGADWPRLQGVHAQASFVDNGMLVQADRGETLGVRLGKAVALIPDFAAGTLDVNAQGAGSGASLLDFVRHSPIGREQRAALSGFTLGGRGNFDFHLSLPLHDTSAVSVQGTAQLAGADFDAPAWNVKLEQMTGPLTFDAHGLSAGPLQAGFHGQPSTLQLAVGAATADPATVLAARLVGRYSIGELVQGYPSLQWLAPMSDGRSDFSLALDIGHAPAGGSASQLLRVDSPLSGIALKLPEPLRKPADAELPLHLSLPLPVGSSDLQVALGEVARGRFRLPSGARPLAATMAFGPTMPSELPAKGLRIRGQAARLDVTGWVQAVVGGSGGDSGPGLDSIEVGADHALLFGHDFASMQIKAMPAADALGIDVASAGIAGHISVPTPAAALDKRGVTARLQRLYWPQDNTPAPGRAGTAGTAGAATTPATTASATAASPRALPDNPAATGITPSALPPLHLWSADLRLGAARLGEARLETWPTTRGMHIDQLRTLSKSVQINASGDWTGTASDSATHMRIDFAAQDLGSMLGALGFEGLFDGGKTRAELDARWPGAPTSLALANMDGKLSLDISHGRIPEVGTGVGASVGRLFGLVSVAELPRRLTLDFGDVFGKGLAFDAITGDFKLADGNATTDNLAIRGPGADISITGRTGLRARDYDQQVLVLPHLGNSLPVVGAVIAGPVGAAAGFAVQGLLGKGLNKAASARYRVTGSWDKPVFTLIEKHTPTPAASPPAAASSSPAPAAASSSGP